MKTAEMKQSVLEILADILGVECTALENGKDLSDLGMNSVKSVELIINLEEKFNIFFDDDELLYENFSTIGNILSMISGKHHETCTNPEP